MAKTPFFTPAYITRSTNVGDAECINLYGEVSEIPGAAKDIGAFYNTPGKTLVATCGNGPIRGMMILPSNALQSLLYVVSGTQVYSVDSNYNVTLVGGNILGNAPVRMIANQSQIAIFNFLQGFIVPGGVPLTGGTIATGGTQYASGDLIYLNAGDGAQTATAILSVTTVGATGDVTAFTVGQGGAFNPQPTGFTQGSTTGSGAGFTLSFPIYGANVPVYQITMPFSVTALQQIGAAQQDGFGLISEPGTYTMWQSNELDFSIWPALNFASASGDPDNIVAILQLQLEMYVIKRRHTEIWYNAGTPGFIFARLTGTYIELGCVAVNSVARAGNTFLMLSVTDEGTNIVVQISGYQPTRVTTHALENEFTGYSTVTDAIGYVYQQNGHAFYVLTFPTANTTWVYDITESAKAGYPMWHRRAELLAGVLNRDWGNSFVFFNQTPIVGDYLTGNLYALDMAALTDNGSTRKWVKSWRASATSTMQPVRNTSLQIDMQTGVGVPDGTNPQVQLDWSDDGGHTFTQPINAAAGPPGATAQRVMYRRLGSTRRNTGLDRVYRLSSTDQFPVTLIGADIL